MIQSGAIKTDYRRYAGSLIMFSFAAIALVRWNSTGELFFLVLSFRDLIASYFLAKRDKAQIEGTKMMAILAYISSGLPLFYFSAPFGMEVKLHGLIADLLTIIGFLIVTWATIDLGTKLGVSAAKRGDKCTKGLYMRVGHPMYWGYAIAQIGWIVINSWNGAIYIVSITLFILRASYENKVLSLKVEKNSDILQNSAERKPWTSLLGESRSFKKKIQFKITFGLNLWAITFYILYSL